MKTGVPGLFDITPVTAYVTSSKSDKISSFSGIEAFSLDGVEGFHQWQKSAVFRNAGRGTADNTGALIFHFSVIIKSEEHTSELQSLLRISYAVFCLKKT